MCADCYPAQRIPPHAESIEESIHNEKSLKAGQLSDSQALQFPKMLYERSAIG